MGCVIRYPVCAIVTLLLCLVSIGVAAEPRDRDSRTDLNGLYRRLSPGMTVTEVQALTEQPSKLGLGEPVTTWLLWQQDSSGRGTEVLRASFRDGRLVRVEYESFGEEHRHLVKGDRTVAMDADEVGRLWRRAARIGQVAENCHEALDAYHRLVLGAQERLTTSEQQDWARALRLRRAVELEAP
jgi:hypothetical protein